jgi:hypothetical protein
MECHIASTPPENSTKNVDPVFVDSGDTPGKSSESASLKLNGAWTAWAHLPHDTDWSVKSYVSLCSMNTVDEVCGFIKNVPDGMIQNCMLFVMRNGIEPLWEHPRNRKGGSFSYKVDTNHTPAAWNELLCRLVGETLSGNDDVVSTINGITISPKRNFCIVKIWLSTCNHQNPRIIDTMKHIVPKGCLFKRHAPEY